MKPAIECIDVNMKELETLLEQARQGQLDEDGYKTLKAAVNTLGYVARLLADKETTIQALRQLLVKPSTEKTDKVLNKAGIEPSRKESNPASSNNESKPKGHGRNGARAYDGARKIKVAHDSLKRGDSCPGCLKGKVYPQKDPVSLVRVVGQAPLDATVWDLEQMRCNLCGDLFTAHAPEEIGPEKYDESAASMIALLKYGSGVPFYRLEGLQASLGIPLPASTQWEIVEETAGVIQPAMDELIRHAAQGEVVHNDDTSMRVMSLKKEATLVDRGSSESKERTGIFTSGIVSTREGRRIALFFTGSRHAGENLAEVLQRRAAEIGPPIQMCDALSRNLPKNLAVVVAHCLAHSRRRFVDVASSFPVECRYVLETFGVVYSNDAVARQQGLSAGERLSFHQTQSGPVLEELHAWLLAQLEEKKVEPNSGLGKAISYLLKFWSRLTLFLRQEGAPLDNNICERALKKAILHRKNSLYYKTPNGAQVGDLFMSLIHTAELSGANPFEYLTELQRHFQRVAANPGEWMPWNYQQTLSRPKPSIDSG
jgi:transposase